MWSMECRGRVLEAREIAALPLAAVRVFYGLDEGGGDA
jgi:hypothetical protein